MQKLGKTSKNREKNRRQYALCRLERRAEGRTSPDEVEFAVLENSGHLSVIPKSKCKVKHPSPLISDGMINDAALQDLGFDREWLSECLLREGVDDYRDVFLCMYQKDGLYVIKKELNSKDSLF